MKYYKHLHDGPLDGIVIVSEWCGKWAEMNDLTNLGQTKRLRHIYKYTSWTRRKERYVMHAEYAYSVANGKRVRKDGSKLPTTKGTRKK